MSYPRYVQDGVSKWVKVDCDAICDHVLAGETVSGYLAYPYTYLIRSVGGKYQAINSTGTLTYGGTDDEGSVDGDDAGAVINAAIAACTTGGTVYLRNGVYTTGTGLVGANGVSLIGEGMGPFEDFAKGTVLDYTGAGKAVDFDECRWFSLANMKIYGANGTGTNGLYFGGAHNDATKTKAVTLSNVVIDSFDYGIQGNTFGPDDSNYYHVFVTNNTIIGVDNLSSMSRFYGGSIAGSPIGFRIMRAAGASADAGAQFFGTVFSNNPVCVDIAGEQSINILSFHSCWLEDTDTLLIDTSNATPATTIGSILFDNCVATVNNATATSFFDLSGINCTLRFIGGTLYSDAAKTIVTNGAGCTIQRLSIQPQAGTDKYTFDDTSDGLLGNHMGVLPLFNDINGYTPGAPIGGTYTSIGHSLKSTINPDFIVLAKAHYHWTTGSTSGKIRLHTSLGNFGASEPAASGARADTVECTNDARSYVAEGGDIDIQLADDNSTAPTLRYAILEYWW